jgi:RNA polymerase sigma-70 factor (ECF subfamily)
MSGLTAHLYHGETRTVSEAKVPGPAPSAEEIADLYREYLPRILNYVRLRVDSESLAEDLTAAVFERALARQHTLRRREAFGAWLFRIAHNVVAGYYRQRRQTLPLEWVANRAAEGMPSPEEAAVRGEEVRRLRAAIATLREREQEIVRLKFGAGLGNQEIAQIMGLQPGHVAVLVFRALQKLRAELEDQGRGTGG